MQLKSKQKSYRSKTMVKDQPSSISPPAHAIIYLFIHFLS